MKKAGLCLILLAASLAPVSAQVTVEVLLDQDQFLPGEGLGGGGAHHESFWADLATGD